MVDRNMAMEQAFMVCKTEELKLQAFEKNPSVSAHRDTLREDLLRRYTTRTADHGHETLHQAAMPASPKACGICVLRRSAQASPGL